MMLLKLRSKVNECKPLNPDQTVKDATGEALKMLWRGAITYDEHTRARAKAWHLRTYAEASLSLSL